MLNLGIRPYQRSRLTREEGNGYGQGKGGCTPDAGPASCPTIAVLRISLRASSVGSTHGVQVWRAQSPIPRGHFLLTQPSVFDWLGLPTCQDGCFRGKCHGEFPDDIRRAVIHKEAEVADGRMENQRDRRGEGAQHLVSCSL